MTDEFEPIVSIVVPVYNNEVTLEELSRRVKAVCEQCCDGRFELIFIDDGSTDKSWEVITALASNNIKGLRLSRNFGQHAAFKAGFVHCKGNYIIIMDADLDDDPALIAPILDRLRGGVEICFTVGESNGRRSGRLTSRIFHKITNNKNPVLADKTPGTMRGFTENVLNAILRYGERRPVYGPLITGLGYRQDFITRPTPENQHSNSSYSFTKRLRLAVDYAVGYTNIASFFFVFASFVAFLGSTVYAAIITVQYFYFGVQLPPGLSLLTLLLLMLFAILYLGIGIIGIYLQRLLNESLARPLYLISETTDASTDVTAPGIHRNPYGVSTHVRSD